MQPFRFRFILQKIVRNSPADIFLLKWGILSLASLMISLAAEIYGVFGSCAQLLSSVLSAPPFYCDMNAAEPLLNKQELFGANVIIVFYAACLVLREISRTRSLAWLLLMITATVLLPFALALWDLFLNTSPIGFSLIVLGIVSLFFTRSAHETT